jgi:RNA polymerase sigma factor (TIGR02999 family)
VFTILRSPMTHPPDALDAIRAEELLPLVYDELRRLAAFRLAREKPGQTLQPTALVHEAWLKLAGGGCAWGGRAQFFAAASEAMRRILVDRARHKARLKRGGDPERVPLEESQIHAPVADDKLLQIHEVLDTLAATDPLKADIVKLRFFVGLNHTEIADALGLNEKTVRRHWEVAKVQLYELILGRAPQPAAD